MQVACPRLADRLADHGEESDDVVPNLLLYLLDAFNIEAGSADEWQRLGRDSAEAAPRFAGQYLDLQPELEAMVVGPDLSDPRRCVTLDQLGAGLLETVEGDTQLIHYRREAAPAHRWWRRLTRTPRYGCYGGSSPRCTRSLSWGAHVPRT